MIFAIQKVRHGIAGGYVFLPIFFCFVVFFRLPPVWLLRNSGRQCFRISVGGDLLAFGKERGLDTPLSVVEETAGHSKMWIEA